MDKLLGILTPLSSVPSWVLGVLLVLLFAVELHAGIGLYRLVLKWGLLPVAADPRAQRKRLSRLEWSITGFFLLLGIATFAAYLPPLAGILAGPLLATHLAAGDELAAVVAAGIGLLLGWVVSRAWLRRTPPRLVLSGLDGS